MNCLLTMIKLLFFLLLHDNFIIGENIKQLPYCANSEKDVGFVLVSTLNGKLTSITADGNFLWDVETGTGPLLISNIHDVELTNNGELVRIIPSLAGSLYKFNGKTIDAIPITADSLLKSSFLYSNELVIAGGREVRTYGIEAKTGQTIYECSPTGCSNKTKSSDEFDDIVLIERTTRTVRAHEARTGTERWNFSVGYVNVKIPQANCINLDSAITNLNMTAIMPEGILNGYKMGSNELLWQYAFLSPIVKVWKWDGRDLFPVDLFNQAKPKISEKELLNLSPSIYLGMHNKQLYIHESDQMIKNIQKNYKYPNIEVAESNSLTRFPWKPISAAKLQYSQDDSTAMSVLYSTEYENGNGYYFYSEIDVNRSNTIFCQSNITRTFFKRYVLDTVYWKELLLLIFTAIGLNLFWNYSRFRYSYFNRSNSAVTEQEKPEKSSETISTTVSSLPTQSDRTHSESSDLGFVSRYVKDFDTVRCLGKGGYGVVFEVKQKIDECGYAIKRITLPDKLKSQQKVLREVKALAKLDHINIVRYCTSWVECPPAGWNLEFDKMWITDLSTAATFTEYDSQSELKKSISTIIDINNSDSLRNLIDQHLHEFDSFNICFGDNSKEDTKHSTSLVDNTLNNSSSNTNEVTFPTTEETSKTDFHISFQEDCTNSNIENKTKSESSSVTDPIVSDIRKDINVTYLYIQMQLCQKDSLRDWLKTQDERKKEVVLPIYNQILSAVEYVHGQKLIHRDLKPSNIFFSQDGFVKIGDFGLVTSMSNENRCDESSDFSRSFTKGAGTFLYMSPEQKDGTNYDHKVDVYSLGIILFELLIPFATEMERYATLSKLRDGSYPDNFSTTFPKEFDILSKMLSIVPSERPEVKIIRTIINEINFQEE